MSWHNAYLGAEQAQFATITTAGTSDTIVAAISGKRIRVLNYVLLATSASTATWKSNTTAISGVLPVGAYGGAVGPFSPAGHFQTAIGEALKLDQGSSANVQGHLTYTLIG